MIAGGRRAAGDHYGDMNNASVIRKPKEMQTSWNFRSRATGSLETVSFVTTESDGVRRSVPLRELAMSRPDLQPIIYGSLKKAA